MSSEATYRIALGFLYRNRLRLAHALLTRYTSASAVWGHLDEDGMSEAYKKAEQEQDFLEKHAIRTYWCQDEDYPYRLAQCPDKPLLLYAKGNLNPSGEHMVAIVGTRSASDRGKQLTRQFVLDLAGMVPDITIVSGLAYGIDIAAHRAALEADVSTIIIPAHGLDRIYPTIHRPEAVRALGKGGILTEYMSGTEPYPVNFLARNRIVAGLCDATLVVESKEHGGSLITAQMAVDYSRDLFAFPGRPTDESARGCNVLIRRQQAALINSAEDFVEAMQWGKITKTPVQTEMTDLFYALTPLQQTLLDKLHEQEDGMHVNLIVMETGVGYSDVSAELTLMELQGLVHSLPGGVYRALK